jgi:hypothetical protein
MTSLSLADIRFLYLTILPFTLTTQTQEPFLGRESGVMPIPTTVWEPYTDGFALVDQWINRKTE